MEQAITFIIGILILPLYIFFARPIQMNGDSMFPQYKDRAYIMTRVFNKNAEIKRGNIIVFDSPKNKKVQFIKRVVGLPEETVKLENGSVYLNGSVLDEPYTTKQTRTNDGAYIKNNEEYKIPKNHYFVLGDNRTNSADSREWGFIPKDNIVSTAWFCYYNCE